MCKGVADHEQAPEYHTWNQVTFLIDQSSTQCVNITITNDNIEENVEFFEIYISGMFRLHGNPKINLNPKEAVIAIYDDDCKSFFSKTVMYYNCKQTYSNL